MVVSSLSLSLFLSFFFSAFAARTSFLIASIAGPLVDRGPLKQFVLRIKVTIQINDPHSLNVGAGIASESKAKERHRHIYSLQTEERERERKKRSC